MFVNGTSQQSASVARVLQFGRPAVKRAQDSIPRQGIPRYVPHFYGGNVKLLLVTAAVLPRSRTYADAGQKFFQSSASEAANLEQDDSPKQTLIAEQLT